MGAVTCLMPGPEPVAPALSRVTRCEVLVWLVTISEIGPAPRLRGETDTRWSSM